jgi:hypothetical protein
MAKEPETYTCNPAFSLATFCVVVRRELVRWMFPRHFSLPRNLTLPWSTSNGIRRPTLASCASDKTRTDQGYGSDFTRCLINWIEMSFCCQFHICTFDQVGSGSGRIAASKGSKWSYTHWLSASACLLISLHFDPKCGGSISTQVCSNTCSVLSTVFSLLR